ncbi:hypothetical protein L1D41_25970 [Vibrio harveyi]|uniref:hypothetical protein n=1 Tax=Vibrio harveyi TaxID=669 RepID=UPI001EFEA230|nr:hypothetical protein [Vibrio harveyi]MCG9613090.1 hypothetical protein [Vibrio harveyi]MCG9671556.1 hypothetical protein [Vibrio harveyi]
MIEYLTIPNEIMNRKNPLHYALFDFKNNVEFKLFVTILAYSTMIYRTTKKESEHYFSVKGFLGENSIITRNNMTAKKIIIFVNKLQSPFFDNIEVIANEIHFKLSSKYKKDLRNNGFEKINLIDLKSIADIRSSKLSVLTEIKKEGYFDYYYLCKVLDLNGIKRRDNRIAKIKKAFKNIEVEFEYKHPKNQNEKREEEHYKFFYSKTSLYSDNKKVTNVLSDDYIDEIFSVDDFDFDEIIDNSIKS